MAMLVKKYWKQSAQTQRNLLAVLLISQILLWLPIATWAQTSAGTAITESVTATYVDPNNSGQTVNSSSNTVTTTVAEVAGMTLTAAGVTDNTGGPSILPNHVLYYNYLITNTGNAGRQFVIPGTTTITGPGTQTSVAYSTDGTNYTTVSGASATTGSVAQGGAVYVRAIVTVNTSGSADKHDCGAFGQYQPKRQQRRHAEPGDPCRPNRRQREMLLRRRLSRQWTARSERHAIGYGRLSAAGICDLASDTWRFDRRY